MPALSNLRIAVIATDGVEEVELLWPIRSLQQAGACVDLISHARSEILAFRGFNPSTRIKSDVLIEKGLSRIYDGLILPGGLLSVDTLRSDSRVLAFVREMQGSEKPIGALSHAPLILVSAGLVGGRALTSSHSIRDDIRNAGGNWLEREAVTQRNWVTCGRKEDVPAFNSGMLDLFYYGVPYFSDEARSTVSKARIV